MNPAVVASPPSAIRAINARKRATSLDLGLGEPTLAPDLAFFEAATARIGREGCRYGPQPGRDELREAIAGHYRYRHLPSAANVCVTNGSQEAVYAALTALLDPAEDDVLLVEPLFPAYAKIAGIARVATRTVALDPAADFAFDVERIVAAVTPRTRMIVLCSPCNPTGRALSPADARALACALDALPFEAPYVLHDEIYREQRYEHQLGVMADVYPRTIAVNSLSKSNALTGLRLGWVCAPAPELAQIVKVHAFMTSCPGTFAQYVAVEAFAAGALGAHRAWYAAQRQVATSAAADAGLAFTIPDGGFYLFVDVAAADDAAFAVRLIEEADVAAIPGSVFGAAGTGRLRTSFVAEPAVLREAYRRIALLR